MPASGEAEAEVGWCVDEAPKEERGRFRRGTGREWRRRVCVEATFIL